MGESLKKMLGTYIQPVLLVDFLVVFACQHVTEVSNGWIVDDGDFVPPLVSWPIDVSSRITGTR
jgi:hypothetical protein